MPLLLVRPGGAKRGCLPILMKYYTSKLVQCSQRSNFMMQSFQLLQPICILQVYSFSRSNYRGRQLNREGGRWMLLPILLKYYIAKAAQQTMQCKVTFVEVVLLPNIKEKQWSGFAQVVFFLPFGRGRGRAMCFVARIIQGKNGCQLSLYFAM